jgi:hypothetical protein
MEQLEKAIKEIITKIPADYYFDVHMIIQKLLQDYDDTYLLSTGNYTATFQYHSKISSIIGSNTELIEIINGKSYSKNIHDKFSECNIFKRKK